MSQRITRGNKVKTTELLMDLSNDFQTQMSSFKDELQKKLESGESSTGSLSKEHKIYVQELLLKFDVFEKNIFQRLKLIEKQINNKCDVIEQRLYNKHLVLYGLQEEDGEVLLDLIPKVFLKHLKISNLDKNDLSDAYRLGKKSEKVRPVIIEFLRMWQRNLVFTNKSKFKGSKMYMNEMLIKPKLLLFNEVKEIYKNKCFTLNGRIVVNLNNKMNFIDTQDDFIRFKDLSNIYLIN